MSPPAKMPSWPVMRLGDTTMVPSLFRWSPSTCSRNPVSTSCPSARTSASASMVSSRPVGRGLPFGVELHHLDGEGRRVDGLDRAEPVDLHALRDGLVGLLGGGGHVLAIAAIDDERLVAEALRDARGVHRGVAAAVDGDAAPELRRSAVARAAQERERVEDLPGVARRDLGALADVRADGEEHRVERAVALLGEQVLDLVIEDERHAHLLDAARSRPRGRSRGRR